MSISRRGFYLVTLFTFAAQYLLHRHLRLFDILPDLLLIYVIFYNLVAPGAAGLVTAFAAGIFQDFLLYAAMGGHSLIYLVTAYLSGRVLAGRVSPAGWAAFLAPAYFSFLSALLYQLIMNPAWSAPLPGRALLFGLFNGICGIPAFAIYRLGLQSEPR